MVILNYVYFTKSIFFCLSVDKRLLNDYPYLKSNFCLLTHAIFNNDYRLNWLHILGKINGLLRFPKWWEMGRTKTANQTEKWPNYRHFALCISWFLSHYKDYRALKSTQIMDKSTEWTIYSSTFTLRLCNP